MMHRLLLLLCLLAAGCNHTAGCQPAGVCCEALSQGGTIDVVVTLKPRDGSAADAIAAFETRIAVAHPGGLFEVYQRLQSLPVFSARMDLPSYRVLCRQPDVVAVVMDGTYTAKP